MPTVKRNGSSIVLKGGKVSCECCIVNCNPFSYPISFGSHAALTSSQYAAIYAGGTWTAQASGSIESTGSGGDFDVTTHLTASGTASNTYSVTSPACQTVFGAGSPTSSVTAVGTSETGDPELIFVSDSATGSMEAKIFGYTLYNSGGVFPIGIFISGRALFSAASQSVYTFGGFPIVFGTDQALLRRNESLGASSLSFVVNGTTISMPALFTQTSTNNDPATVSLTFTISFVSSAP